jgi:hypothetical protein
VQQNSETRQDGGTEDARPLAAPGGNRLPILAAEIEAAHQAVQGAFRTTLERAAHCGRLLIEAKALVAHGNWLPWIKQNTTVGPRETQRYMRVADRWREIEANASAETHLTLTDAVALLADHNHRAQGTGENEWYTPARELEAARAVLGEFDLDPACSHRAQATVRAKKYFTVEDDGLAQDWHGRVWLNPPYEQPHIGPSGEKASPTQGQAFFYFGDDLAAFGRVFSRLGGIFVKLAPEAAQ